MFMAHDESDLSEIATIAIVLACFHVRGEGLYENEMSDILNRPLDSRYPVLMLGDDDERLAPLSEAEHSRILEHAMVDALSDLERDSQKIQEAIDAGEDPRFIRVTKTGIQRRLEAALAAQIDNDEIAIFEYARRRDEANAAEPSLEN